ncbi:MAG: hypothetical protein CMO12_04760 [Thaumarchaeota archaeon]|nr:hypothetical protein [Nitrososphaerota archaeon]|tara:strand:- start:7243 stop:7674 length:432 start_codon:yes stop_codon:yes gene_type:complete
MNKAGSESPDDYVNMTVAEVGFTDQVGLEGFLLLSSHDGRKFPIRAFSGEVAKHMDRFRKGDRSSIPTIYNLVEELADMNSIFLMAIDIYQTGDVLRANLHFQGRNGDFVLKHYRASDCIALATFYGAPIRIPNKMLAWESSK